MLQRAASSTSSLSCCLSSPTTSLELVMSSENPRVPCRTCGAEGVCWHRDRNIYQVIGAEGPLFAQAHHFDIPVRSPSFECTLHPSPAASNTVDDEQEETRVRTQEEILRAQPASATLGYHPYVFNPYNRIQQALTNTRSNNAPPSTATAANPPSTNAMASKSSLDNRDGR